MNIKRIELGTDKPVKRNVHGQIINEVGVTFSEWGENLHKQYYESMRKIKRGALSSTPNRKSIAN